MKTFAQRATEEARLVMLQELERQTTGQLPIRMFPDALEVAGHNYSDEWILTELRGLEELRLVKLITVGDGDPKIAELTRRGQQVVNRRLVVEGVKRPDFGG